MNEETNLPEGLQLAVKLIAQIGDDESDRAISAVHAACDLAQRVAELEAERDKLRRERDEWQRIASAYSPAKELAEALKQAKASGDAARKERDYMRAIAQGALSDKGKSNG